MVFSSKYQYVLGVSKRIEWSKFTNENHHKCRRGYSQNHLESNRLSVKELIDQNANKYQAHYNEDILVNIAYPDNLTETFNYDDNGFLKETIKRSGRKIQFNRDDKGFAYEKKYPTGKNVLY